MEAMKQAAAGFLACRRVAVTGDPGHKAMRLMFMLTGNVPRRV
jgi:hypothetical protein